MKNRSTFLTVVLGIWWMGEARVAVLEAMMSKVLEAQNGGGR